MQGGEYSIKSGHNEENVLGGETHGREEKKYVAVFAFIGDNDLGFFHADKQQGKLCWSI